RLDEVALAERVAWVGVETEARVVGDAFLLGEFGEGIADHLARDEVDPAVGVLPTQRELLERLGRGEAEASVAALDPAVAEGVDLPSQVSGLHANLERAPTRRVGVALHDHVAVLAL